MCGDKSIGGFNEIFADPALSDEVHDGEEHEGLVGCAMVPCRRVPIPPLSVLR